MLGHVDTWRYLRENEIQWRSWCNRSLRRHEAESWKRSEGNAINQKRPSHARWRPHWRLPNAWRYLRKGSQVRLCSEASLWLMSVVGFSTDLTCSWLYHPDATDIDYDAVWNQAKNCIIESWGGDFVKGVLSTVSSASFCFLRFLNKNLICDFSACSSHSKLLRLTFWNRFRR